MHTLLGKELYANACTGLNVFSVIDAPDIAGIGQLSMLQLVLH